MVRQVRDVRPIATAWQIQTASLLLATMPLCFAVSTSIKLLPMALLFLAGTVLLIARPESRAIYRIAWPVAAVCLLRLLYDIGNFLAHGLAWRTLDLPSQTLLFLAIAALFSMPLRQRVVAYGFSLATIVLGASSLFQRFAQGVDRPYGLNGGEWAAVEFAMYLLILSLLSMLQALRPDATRGDRYLHGVAVVIGLYGAVLTQSRGPLLAFIPACLTLMLWHALRTRQWRRTLAVFATIVVGMLTITATLHREMVDRMATVPAQIAMYGADNTADGAIGERLEMWRLAWQAFLEHPMAGIGLDQFGTYVQHHVVTGTARESIAKYVHPHSEYFESMVAGGVPALFVLLLFLLVPLVFFARRLRHESASVAWPAAGGLMVVGMYGLCAFSDNVFYRAMPQSLYLFLVLGLAVSMGRELRNLSLLRS